MGSPIVVRRSRPGFRPAVGACVALGAMLALCGGPSAVARPWRVAQVPNGNIAGCATCHVNPSPNGPANGQRNVFGLQVEGIVTPNGSETFWPQVFGMDADGDLWSNGQELQDPSGGFAGDFSDPPPPLGNPACVSHPAQTASTPPGGCYLPPTPTPLPTATATATPTPSRTATATASPTATPSAMSSATPSATPSATGTPTASPVPTATPGVWCAPDTLLATLENPAPATGDIFGRSVAVSGNFVVVGDSTDDPGGVVNAGTAYVLDATTGALIATLDNPAPTADDEFGNSVAISGNAAVVGAYSDDPGGSAYVFNATTGGLIITLHNPEPTAFDNFGGSVAVSGNVAVVGADGDDPGGVSGAGTAYVFDITTGALTATLDNPAPGAGDDFGWSVALSGNIAVVGAYRADPGGVENAGAAYVFDATTGVLVSTLTSPAAEAVFSSDAFGFAVAVSGNVAVVGAFAESPGGVAHAGTAYVFDCTTGALTATLNSPAPTEVGVFGWSVAASGGVAVVGAPFEGSGGASGTRRAYVFDVTTGALTATLDNPAPGAADNFGWSVGISGGVAVVGVPSGESGGVNGAGRAYTYGLNPLCPTPTPTVSPTAAATATPSATSTAVPCCPGDANNSGSFVDANDFIAVQASFGADNGVGGPGDANCSGSFVDANDFIAVQANFGADCG